MLEHKPDYKAAPWKKSAALQSERDKASLGSDHKKSRPWLEVWLTTFCVVFAVVAYLLGVAGVHRYLVVGLWTISYLSGGWFGLLSSYEAFKEKSLNIDVLMLLAALGAAFIGAPAEGAGLLFLFSLSNTLQSYATSKNRTSIAKLLELRPDVANIKRGESWQEMPLSEVQVGDICLIRPGENIPLDGVIKGGASEVDQSPITGESVLVFKKSGDFAFAGSANKTGALELEVKKPSEESTLAKIVEMVENARAKKSKTQRWLEKAEKYYAIFVLTVGFLLVLVPVLLKIPDFYGIFYRAITWLVVASPCALIISTPASILSAIANAAQNGVLFKGGLDLEAAATIEVVALDKTGTLTYGKPQLVSSYSPVWPLEELIFKIAPLEVKSEHALGQAVLDYAKEKGIKYNNQVAENFNALPGKGVIGEVAGREYWIGNQQLFSARKIKIPEEFLTKVKDFTESGRSVMIVAVKKDGVKIGTKGKYKSDHFDFLAVLGFVDMPRDEAKAMVSKLKSIGIQKVVMLTGDNKGVAAFIAQDLLLDDFYAELLPEQKAKMLEEISKQQPVVMVGDGINDAPSFVAADLGVAMGKGATDIAIDTADVVLMSNNLKKIPFLIKLARQARKVVWQNLAFSLLVILCLVVINFSTSLPLTVGVIGHEGSTLIVVLNGLRLLFFKD